MNTIFIILGFILLVLAIVIVFTKIKEVTVGGNVSRFIIVLILYMGYDSYAGSIATLLSLKTKISSIVLAWLIPIVLTGLAAWFLFQVIKSWRSEGGTILKAASGWVIAAFLLIIASRFLFAAVV